MKLKAKYTNPASVKKTRDKGGGNNGSAGRKWRRKMRGHSGGQITPEEKILREAQSKAARANQVPKVIR
jgi:hypothetical protein